MFRGEFCNTLLWRCENKKKKCKPTTALEFFLFVNSILQLKSGERVEHLSLCFSCASDLRPLHHARAPLEDWFLKSRLEPRDTICGRGGETTVAY